MAAYTSLVSSFLFPLHERFKCHDSVALRRNMEEIQWWSKEKLMELQVKRLRSFLHEVAQTVPFYQSMFAQYGFNPESLRSTDDLQKLPFLTKAIIRSNTSALKHQQAQGLIRFTTGGSTGEPLQFFVGKQRISHDVAAKWRATRWWGVDIGDPEVVVWGSPIELGKQDIFKHWRDMLFRTRLLPAFEMSETRLDQFIKTLRQVKPRMLFGYPSALTHLARHASNRGESLKDIGLKVIFVTAERLYDEQRKTLNEIFGCPVANGYGGRDAGFIAHECPEGGMHLTADDLVVEIVNQAGQVQPAGVPGEIVVTHFYTRDFPFIRYRTGDIGTLAEKPCNCGRGLPLLRNIAGRSTDFVVASDGTVLHGLALIYILRDLTGVVSFKVVQESRALTKVQLVTDATFSSHSIDQIVSGFKQRLGAEVVIEVSLVNQIQPEKSGKFRYVISHA